MANFEDFRDIGKEMVDYICDYRRTIEDRPPLSLVEPGYLRKLIPEEAPQKPESFDEIKKDVERVIMPGVTHWHSPHFHAYFPTASSYPAVLGDMLSGAIGCIGFSWISSPACTELETVVLDWLGKLLKLPEEFLAGESSHGGGVIQGSASEATLVALLAAKEKMIRKQQEFYPNMSQYQVMSKLVMYSSDQSHSSVEKAALIASIQCHILPTDSRHALRGHILKKAIREDKEKGLIPFFVCANIGTTNSCAFDPLHELGPICEGEVMWLHVDAAYAGSALICPEYRHLINGVEYASSFNFNCHKFLQVNFDCSPMWVRERKDLISAFHLDPVYLQHEHQGLVTDYRHWQIPLGRRFRSLKLWFVLRMFGVERLQECIRTQVRLAREFKALVISDRRFEVSAEVVLGLVCFRLKGSNLLNKELIERINKSGKIHMIGAQLKDQYILRFAVCASCTETRHVKYAWDVVQERANDLLGEIQGTKDVNRTKTTPNGTDELISPTEAEKAHNSEL